jgi:hypothetical protein
MKKIMLCSLILLLGAPMLAFAQTSGAIDPADVGVGARPLGMGKAYSALSGDASGIFINPAGLAGIKSYKFTSMAATLLGEVNYTVLGGAVPFWWGNLGIGYIGSSVGNIPLTDVVASRIVATGSANYSSSLILLSYSADVWQDISFGSSLKLFSQNLSGNATLEAQGSGSGYDLDLGFIYRPNKWLRLGLVQTNFLPSSMAKFTWKNNTTEDIVAVTKLGVAVQMIGPRGLYQAGYQELTVGFEEELNLYRTRPAAMHLGMEWWPIEMFAIRLGIDQKPRGAPELVDNNLTAGVGLKYAGFTLDYAYHQYGGISENTTHYISIGYVGQDEFRAPTETEKSYF